MTACGDPSRQSNGQTCEVSTECPTGQICDGGACVPAGLGPNNTCFGGVCCDSDGPCVDPYELLCADAGGCTCRILHAGGATTVNGTPRLLIAPTEAIAIEAVLSATSGGRLPAGPFGVSVDNGDSFIAAEHHIIGRDAAGVGTVTVEFGRTVSCQASIENLGPVPGDMLRLAVVDAASGAPVAGARVIVDWSGDGVDDGETAATDAAGLSVTRVAPTAAYDITVQHADYDFITVLGIEPAQREVFLPLQPRPVDLAIGGVTGLVDFDAYEESVLGGRSLPFQVGMVATSFPLEALLDFDLGLLFGGAFPDWGCDDLPAAGCYAFDIPGLIDDVVPMWGGLVLSLASEPIKPYFESVGQPGERFLWSVAGEFESSDMAAVFTTVMSDSAFCACDVSDACDASCGCDSACDTTLAGRMLRAVAPLLRRSAAGVRGNLVLEATPYSDWLDYITAPFGAARTADARFPALDGGEHEPLRAVEPLQHFSDVALPQLPADPVAPGRRMEGVVALSGALTRGAGFVPLGLGVGFDCDGVCTGASNGGLLTSGYDGHLNAVTLCEADSDDVDEQCQAGVPEKLAAGHLGLFVAEPHGGLEGEAQRTAIVSLPIDSLAFEKFRASALLLDGELDSTVDLQAALFPEVPLLPDVVVGRSLELTATGDADVLRLTVSSGGRTWTVIGQNQGRTVVLPPALEGASDPLAADELRLGVASLRFSGGRSVAELVGRGSTQWSRAFADADAFATQLGAVPRAE